MGVCGGCSVTVIVSEWLSGGWTVTVVVHEVVGVCVGAGLSRLWLVNGCLYRGWSVICGE